MTANRIVFLNYAQVESGAIGTKRLPRDYMLACRFLHCSIIDRTATLDQGFEYTILDPIPPPVDNGPTFGALCDTLGEEIVCEAMDARRDIHVLWSGGIDSTTALIAILKAAVAHACVDRLQVLLTLESVQEYPRFFLQHIDGHIRYRPIRAPISSSIDRSSLTITGEHGDQLFGSHLLRSYVERGFGSVDYRDILTAVLVERLRSALAAHRVRRYLQPVVDAAPVPIHTLFDYFWWLNFSLKWQEVSLRLCVFGGDAASAIQGSIRHFFRDQRFQSWALGQHVHRCPPAWDRYKDEAKRYILAFTGDDRYYETKEKEDSLRNVMPRSQDGAPIGLYMRRDFRPVVQPPSVPVHA